MRRVKQRNRQETDKETDIKSKLIGQTNHDKNQLIAKQNTTA